MTDHSIGETLSGARPRREQLRSRKFDHESRKHHEIVRQVLQRSIQEQIRDRAYELYLHRGCRDGYALQDWLDAELEMLSNR
jgi:hypothetical protein